MRSGLPFAKLRDQGNRNAPLTFPAMDALKILIKKVAARNVKMRSRLTRPHHNVEGYYQRANTASVFIRF